MIQIGLVLFVILLSLISGFQSYKLYKYRSKDEFFKHIIKDIPLDMYIKDTDGNIKICNVEFGKLFNLNTKELKHKNIKDIYPAYHLDKIREEDELIFKEREPKQFEWNIDFIDNNNHYFRVVKTPIFDKDNKITDIIVILNNKDDEKEAEFAKEAFIATLTHDLKTPTFAQMNILNLLLQGSFGKLNSDQHEMVELMKGSCEYTANLVSTVLDTYRYENGNMKLKFEDFDIVELVSNVCKSTRGLAKEKGQNLCFRSYAQNSFIQADYIQIKRVVLNLISNAITYGLSKTDVVINIGLKDEQLEFSVTNKSAPISKQELGTLFERFKKTKIACSNNASSGLGLYLSKQIINMHNGMIYADSSEDGTCIFGFKLPVKNSQTSRISAKV